MDYTKGPWKWKHPEYTGQCPEGFVTLNAPEHRHFAEIVYTMEDEQWFPGTSVKVRNTVNLITAAPELYEALKAVAPLVDHIYGEDSDITQRVRYAIAKAELNAPLLRNKSYFLMLMVF